MASVKYTAFVNEIKGKISGTTFKGGYGGSVIQGLTKDGGKKKGGKLTHADAGRFINPQLNISLLATSWKKVPEEDKLAWETAAQTTTFPNRFGELYTPSGFQYYMSVNMNMLTFGVPIIGVPAVKGNVPSYQLTARPPGWPVYVWDWDCFSDPYCWDTTYAYVIGVSDPVATPVLNPPNVRIIKQFVGLTEPPMYDISDDWIKFKGSKVTKGWYWGQVQVLNTVTGQVCKPFGAWQKIG